MKRPPIGQPAQLNTFKKVVVHGPSGAGKTRFAASFPSPLIFDFEGGTSSLGDRAEQIVVPASAFRSGIEFSPPLVLEYVAWLASKEADQYQTVIIDSLTELQEQFIGLTLPKYKNGMQAYGEWNSYVRQLMSMLRGLNKHYVVIARTKMGESQEGEASMLYPQISPAAWTNVPALADYGFYIQAKTPLGAKAPVPTLFTQSSKAWTKTRSPMTAEIGNPTFATVFGAS